LYSENNKNQVRKAFVEYEKYVCSCGSYKRNGLICRHVFAIANVNQDKSLAKFVINQRWETPLFDNNLFIECESFAFNMKEMLHFLGDNNNDHAAQNDEKIEDPKTKIVKPTFRAKKIGKGAPKKEKRPKSVVEKVPKKAQNPPKRGHPTKNTKATSEKGLNTQPKKQLRKILELLMQRLNSKKKTPCKSCIIRRLMSNQSNQSCKEHELSRKYNF